MIWPRGRRSPHRSSSKEPPIPRLPQGTAFAGLVVTFTVVMIGTTMPTPMYAVYQSELGFSPIVQTVIFAVYAVGVLAALLLFGRWSDLLGRRPLLLAGVGFSLASSIVFVLAGPVPVLLVGRLLSGISAGIFAGAATAAVIEAAPPSWSSRSSAVATAANTGGLGLGPLLAGLAVQFLPAPLHLSFAVHAVAVALCWVLVLLAPETVTPTRRPRLRPQKIAVPAEVRPVFVSAATAGFAGFAVLGLFTAISPRIVSEVLGNSNHAVAGLLSFLLLGASAAAQLGLRRFDTDRTLTLGCVLLIAGILLVGLSVATASFPELVIGALIAGVGQGMSFSKGLATVNARVDPAQRAGVTSSYFVVLYVAISLPVVGVGAASMAWGLVTAAITFAVAVAVLAAVALTALLILQRRGAQQPDAVSG
ncbi:MAG: MFS transporter [Pseudonocardia sp.]|nr:MFS transporter [Pseudonocardia sp.]